MNIDEKLKRFEESCEKLALCDAERLDNKLNSEIEEQINLELEEYVKKQEFSYKKQCEKIVKEYNKFLFDYEIECKKNILNVKSIIRKNLIDEVEEALYRFVDQKEYIEFLAKSITEVLEVVNNDINSVIYITNKDYIANKLALQKYNFEFRFIDNYYIGGCKLENRKLGITIDNTLRYRLEKCNIDL